LTVFAWIFFRANDLSHAFSIVSEIFSSSLFTLPYFINILDSISLVVLVLLFVIVEWNGRSEQFAIAKFGIKWNKTLRRAFYYTIILIIFWFGGKEQQFIYFQF
jgi:hypothetical protein